MSQVAVENTRSSSTRSSRAFIIRRPPPRAAIFAVAIAVVQLLFMFSLTYPASHAVPHGLDLGLVGPDAVTQQIEANLRSGGDRFDVHRYADAETAREAIRDRRIYGAIVVTQDGPTLLVASAANPGIAAMFRSQAAAFAPNGTPTVEDVIPVSTHDPNGTGFLTTTLPLTIVSIVLGIVGSFLERRPLRLIGWIALTTALASIGASWIDHGLGIFTGTYPGTLITLALLVFGIGSTAAALARLGNPGPALAVVFALVILCLGIPGTGAMVPSPLLAEPWRAIGPLLPPGAAVDALRGINFFEGARTGGSFWVLIAWCAIGLALAFVPIRRLSR